MAGGARGEGSHAMAGGEGRHARQEVRDIQNALEYEWKVGARFYKVPPPRHSSHDIVPTVFFFFLIQTIVFPG